MEMKDLLESYTSVYKEPIKSLAERAGASNAYAHYLLLDKEELARRQAADAKRNEERRQKEDEQRKALGLAPKKRRTKKASLETGRPDVTFSTLLGFAKAMGMDPGIMTRLLDGAEADHRPVYSRMHGAAGVAACDICELLPLDVPLPEGILVRAGELAAQLGIDEDDILVVDAAPLNWRITDIPTDGPCLVDFSNRGTCQAGRFELKGDRVILHQAKGDVSINGLMTPYSYCGAVKAVIHPRFQVDLVQD